MNRLRFQWHFFCAAFVCLLLLGAVGTAHAQDPRGFRGVWNAAGEAWGYDAMTLGADDVWRVTVQAIGSDHRFKIAHSNWDYDWTFAGPMPVGQVVDFFHGTELSSTPLDAVGGRYYSFAMENVPQQVTGRVLVQETEQPPVQITTVVHVVDGLTSTIPLTISAAPSLGERIYVRYTLDDWETSTFVAASGSGTTGSVEIHHDAADEGMTVQYYALTTTLLDWEPDRIGLQTLRWNNNGGAFYSYVIGEDEAPVFPGGIYINEVMASNSSTVQDEDGDYPDWIELYNANAEPVHLQGWGLSDNFNDPFKWVFGDVTIQQGQFMLVWASGKDRPDAAEPHTSWSISSAGEEVILTDPSENRVDELEPTSIPTDVSYGRQPDGTGDWFYFENPTPRSANTGSGLAGLLEPPQFSAPGGMYVGNVQLDITSPVDGAVVRYTTDGSEPTAGSPIFTDPITLGSREGEPNEISEIPTNNNLDWDPVYRETWFPPEGEVFKIHAIRARVFKEGYLPSPIAAQSYLIDSLGANRYSLPVISIASDEANLFDAGSGIYVPDNYWNRGREWERSGSINFIEEDGTLAFSGEIGIRIHGGTTRSRPRKSLRIYARNPATFEYQLFPDKDIDRFDTFILRNGGNDWGDFIFRDVFMQSLLDQTDLDRQYSRPAILFINGEYWGIHNIRDRFDDGYIEHHYGLDEHEFVQFESVWDGVPGDVQGLPHFDRGNPDIASAYMDVHEFIRDEGVTSPANYEWVQDRMDIDNFIDFYQAHIFFGNTDWPGNNIRIWRSVETNRVEGAHPRHDARLRFMVFDTDFGFGLDFEYVPGSTNRWYDSFFGFEEQHNTLGFATSSFETSWANNPRHTVMLRRLLENNDFRERFVTRFMDQLNTAFSRSSVTNRLAELVAVVQPEINEHVQRWRQPWDWEDEVDRVRSYGEQRTAQVKEHVRQHFGLDVPRSLTLAMNNTDGGDIRVNTVTPNGIGNGELTPAWSGDFFPDYPVTLTAVPREGYRFVEWQIENGNGGGEPVVIATDQASNYSDWTQGSNGGVGFGNWFFSLPSDSSQGGVFLDNDLGGWGIYANSGEIAFAWRSLNSPLDVGQTFSVRFRHGAVQESGSVSVVLLNENFTDLIEFQAFGMGQEYSLNGVTVPLDWQTVPIDLDITLTSSNTFDATIRSLGESAVEMSGTLLPASDQEIRVFDVWNRNAGHGSPHDFFVTSMQVTEPGPEPAGMQPLGESGFSTNETITVDWDQSSSYQAIFDIAPLSGPALVHYWNFNDTDNLLTFSYSLVTGAEIQIDTGTVTAVTWGTGQDFAADNAQFDDPAGAHLRVNDPIGSTVDVSLPTTGFEDIVVRYETRRSGSGAGTQFVSYTTNGVDFVLFDTLTITTTPTVQTLNFSAIPAANDNADFGIRITFDQGDGGTVGNNRFDNLTLEGEPLEAINFPPEVVEPIEFQEMIAGESQSINLVGVYDDPEGDFLIYSAESSATNVVEASVVGATLNLETSVQGEALVTVFADDGNNPPVATSFRVLVYPEAHVLEAGPFEFGEWDENEPLGSFPDHMIFLQSDSSDTLINSELLYAYDVEEPDTDPDHVAFPYRLSARTRINGLGEDGIAFINTGRGRDLGGALLALDTRNVTDAPVGWLAGTVLANSRIYAMRLQYRVGTSGEFIDVLDEFNNPVVYVRHPADGHTQPMDPVLLPAAAMDEEYVQLLWRYYWTDPAGATGPRAQLRLDDIVVANSDVGAAASVEFVTQPPTFWQSGRPLPSLSVRAVDANGVLVSDFDGDISLSVLGDAVLDGTLTVTAVGGVAEFTDLSLTGLGTNRIAASSGTLDGEYTDTLSLADVTGLLVPQFIQGEQDAFGDNNDRIPFAYRARIEGLLPNTTYRYGNRVITGIDDETDNGAGNMIFATGSSTNWIRNTNAPRFRDTDYADRHYEFSTDATGTYEGWFVTEPTGNARFTPGNTVQLRIILNDGMGGEAYQHFLTLPETVSVIRFGTLPGEASGIMAQSAWTPRDFVFLYDEVDGVTRPLAGVPVEITGSWVDDRYAPFYEQTVATTPQFWGTLIPNTLASGVRRIESRDFPDAEVVAVETFATGIPETIDPSQGLNAILLDADEDVPVFIPGGDGDWDLAVNWTTPFYPNGVGANAIIGPPALTNREVTIRSSVTIGELLVDNADSPHMNRIATDGDGVFLTFDNDTDPALLTIDGSGSGFVEFGASESILLQSDLLVTITNVNENHGLEGVLDDDFGALRFRNTWTGPGGLTKTGAGVMTMTGGGKDYTGPTVVDLGVLRVTEPATPSQTASMTVHPGGQLRLVSEGDRIYPLGGLLTLNSMGRGGDVPAGEELGVLGALRFDPGSNGNRAELTNAVEIAGSTSLHVDGSENVMELSGPLSGAGAFSKSGGGLLVLSGDSSGYTIPVVISNGQLKVNGSLGSSTVTVRADGAVRGSGQVEDVSGVGVVSPGPGLETLTANSVNGLSYQFVMSETGSSLLRLTSATPFAASLNVANRIDLFLDVESLFRTNTFAGAFFTDENDDFTSQIGNADWNLYVRDEEGAVEHDGEMYSPFTEDWPLEIDTVAETRDFGDGPVNGRILQIGFADEDVPVVTEFTAEPGDNVSVTIPSQVGFTYRLEYTTNLTAEPIDWQVVESKPGTGANLLLEDADWELDEMRLYRVVVSN